MSLTAYKTVIADPVADVRFSHLFSTFAASMKAVLCSGSRVAWHHISPQIKAMINQVIRVPQILIWSSHEKFGAEQKLSAVYVAVVTNSVAKRSSDDVPTTHSAFLEPTV